MRRLRLRACPGAFSQKCWDMTQEMRWTSGCRWGQAPLRQLSPDWRDCALISDSIASVLGVTVRRFPGLYLLVGWFHVDFLLCSFLRHSFFAYRRCCVRHIATRRRRLFPRRLAAFLFLVVTITITAIIIVINIIITGPKNRLPTPKRSTTCP